MARNINSALVRETQKTVVYPFQAVKISLSASAADDIRVWDGTGNITINNETYTGVGLFGDIAPITENNQISAEGITLSLNGIPKGNLATTLGLDYQGKRVDVYVGAFDNLENKNIVGAPYRVWTGFADVMTITEASETLSIALTAESRMITASRAKIRTLTSESQRVLYPMDEGFDFVPSLQNTTIRVR